MSMLNLCIALAFAQQVEQPDFRYMQHGVYMAGSMIEDPTAAGGFFAAENHPVRVPEDQLSNKIAAILTTSGKGLEVRLSNGGEIAWIRAADSNLFAWLEAKDMQGNWQPIEYKHWYSCGNSYHRVALQTGYGWKWEVKLPAGEFQTRVRWRYETSEGVRYSNEITAKIPAHRFELPAEVAKQYKLAKTFKYPALVPVELGF